MSAKDALGDQFMKRRAEQLKEQGMSLVRPPKPAPDSEEASKLRHPAGKKRPLRSVD